MKIEDLTIGEAKKLAALFNSTGIAQEHPYEVGKNYFIRSVTHHFTGKLVAVYPQELALEGAAWIADDGRLSDALAKETFSEVEMFPDRVLIIGRAAIIDAIVIEKLPTSTK